MIHYEEFRGKPVVSRREGAIVGKFDDFQFNLETWEIYGYRIKGVGVFSKAGGVTSLDLDQIGRDVAFVGSEEQVVWSGGGRNSEDGRAWASRYLGTKVISRAGVSLGEIKDLIFEPGTRKVVAIELDQNRAARLDEKVHTGADAIVLDDPQQAMPVHKAQGEDGQAWWTRMRDTWAGKARAEEPPKDDDPE